MWGLYLRTDTHLMACEGVFRTKEEAEIFFASKFIDRKILDKIINKNVIETHAHGSNCCEFLDLLNGRCIVQGYEIVEVEITRRDGKKEWDEITE